MLQQIRLQSFISLLHSGDAREGYLCAWYQYVSGSQLLSRAWSQFFRRRASHESRQSLGEGEGVTW